MPVLQAVVATTKRAAWLDSPRGLGAADLAMHVVLPELDGRVLAGVDLVQGSVAPLDGLAFTGIANRPEPDRIDAVADRVAALVRLQATPRAKRRIAVLMPDYPGAPGRTGYAVGLDVPASVIALLADLAEAGYAVADVPQSSKALLDALGRRRRSVAAGRSPIASCWRSCRRRSARRSRRRGARRRPIPMCATARSASARKTSAMSSSRLPPDRGRPDSRRADYHDPSLPPRHALLAFGAVAAACRQHRRHRPHGRARHAGMAARQGGGADGGLLPRGGGRRRCR